MRRRSPGAPMDLGADEWNTIASRVESYGNTSFPSDLQQWHVEGFGRNKTGETLEVGVPILLGPWIQETSGAFASSKPKGFYDLYFAYVPNTLSEALAMNASIHRLAVTLDPIENNQCGRVAISGCVAVKMNGSAPFAKPYPKSDTRHKTNLVAGNWGVKVVGSSIDSTFAIVDLDTWQFDAAYSLTQTWQGIASGTSATVDSTTSLFVQDVYSCASWQVNGDQGIATLQSNRFVIKFPWCVNA